MKTKNLARTLAMLLTATSILAGCTGNDSSSSSSSKSEADTSKAESSVADIEKVSTFNYFNMATGKTNEEFNGSDLAKLVKEHTGYDVVFDQAPADAADAQTAVTNIFMSRSDYQAVKVTKNQFYSLLANDALKEITPYVEASENLKTQISEFGWQTATKEGKIYAIPQKDATLANSVAIAFRADWLKEYNTANPSAQIALPAEENGYSMTLSEFKSMLTYFKTKVPQGGKAMAVDINGVYLENILPAFGVYQEWADVNGSLEYYINQPGFEDYMKYMQGLYDEGLITYQATSGDAGVVKLMQSKSIGAGRIPHWNAVTIEKSDASATDANIGYIKALVPDDCKGDASKVRAFGSEAYSYYTVIPKYATDSQAASVIDWADKKLDADFFIKLAIGTENETFQIKDGQYYPILPAFDEKQGLADKFMDGTREADYAKYWLCRTRKTEAQDKMFSIANYNIAETGIKNPVTVMPPNGTYDNVFSGVDTEIRTALITSLYQTDGRKSFADIQALYTANSGADLTKAVTEWYTTWDNKTSFNAVKPR